MDKRRVLVLDDEMLVAMMLEDMLDDLGFEVVGPFGADLNLGRGQLSTPVAEILRERGVPFLLATGYGANAQTDELGHAGLLPKPFSTGDVEAALKAMLG
jgi:hypothetical protein